MSLLLKSIFRSVASPTGGWILYSARLASTAVRGPRNPNWWKISFDPEVSDIMHNKKIRHQYDTGDREKAEITDLDQPLVQFRGLKEYKE